MKILNLYAGVGGNRAMWGNSHEITAIEKNPQIAAIYKDIYPDDDVIVTDAHEYLLYNYKDYDFIWTSPPCQSHSQMRQNIAVRFRGSSVVYADMRLYQEIILLRYNFKGKYIVENVKPYYDPLIAPSFLLDRHLFWSNFHVGNKIFKSVNLRSAQINDLSRSLGIRLDKYRIANKRQILRNCVHPEVGKHILEEAILQEPKISDKNNLEK